VARQWFFTDSTGVLKIINLLVDKASSNITILKQALSILPDNAIRDVFDSDVEKYEVVRVADEVVIDLMRVCLRDQF
jgi:BioD-like phosphotransacetylase family protein